MSAPNSQKRTGFAFVELLVVIAVIGTVVGLLLPAMQIGREGGVRTATMNNLKQCALGLHGAHDQNGKFPPYYGVYGPKNMPFSLHTHLLPFVEQANLYNNPDPKAIVRPYLSTMDTTHTNDGAGAANFPINLRLYYSAGGSGELMTKAGTQIYPRMPGSFPDGVSNTLFFANKYMNCGKGGSMWADTNAPESLTAATFGKSMAPWQKAPKQEACDPAAGTAVSFTPDAILVAMGDASVKAVAVGIDAKVWQAAHTPGASDGPVGDIGK